MALLDAKPEQPHSKTLRYAVSGVAAVILLTFALWYFVLRFLPERRVVTQFMDALVAEKFETAYQLWKPVPTYTYQRFLSDWGPEGFYGPVKSYRIVRMRSPSKSSGITVLLEISPEPTFPQQTDAKSGRTRSVAIWVDARNLAFSFPP